jgi:phosphopantothenate-cysteine ligase
MHSVPRLQLETDQALLIPKSRTALSRYGHQLVIGNDLHKRKYEVVFVERLNGNRQRGEYPLPGGETPSEGRILVGDEMSRQSGEEYKETWLRLSDLDPDNKRDGDVEIEEMIIEQLVRRHSDWMAGGKR